jgi:hypothetical protein
MGFNGIDTLTLTYNLEELGIKKANVIDAMYTKQERYEYEPGGNDVKFTSWRGKLISNEYNQEINAYCDDQKFTMSGSIPKFINGNNFQGITSHQIIKAFDSLSNVIGSDMYQGTVTRLDYASNLFLEHSPKLYIPFFGDSHKFKRIEYGSSVGYKGSRGQARYKTLEDKVAWAKDTRNKIPEAFHDKHIMRYENRLKSANRIAHVLDLGTKKPTLKDILTIDGRIKTHQDWRRQYENIIKQNNIIDYTKYMQKDYYSPSQAFNCYVLSLMQIIGEDLFREYKKFIVEEQKMGVGQLGYNNISKLNKLIKEKTQWVRNDNSMIREIDDAVKNTYYMS